MIPLFSTSQVREIDEFAFNNLKMPGILLMENASLQIFSFIKEKIIALPDIRKIGFVCGKGNNGGDGFAAARHFANDGYEVTAIYFGNENEFSGDAAVNFRILNSLASDNNKIHLKLYESEKDIRVLNGCGVIVDAMLGSGSVGTPREPFLSILRELNIYRAIKIAVDIPTGLNSDTGYFEEAFKADLTVTLGEFKKGLFVGKAPEVCGELVKGNIGVPSLYFDNLKVDDYLIEPEDVIDALPQKSKISHKYSTGKVLVIAGSGKLPGAALFTVKAALKAGCGAPVLAFPKSVRKFIHKNLPEVVVESYQDENTEIFRVKNIGEIEKRLSWTDVLAIGPGLGRDTETLDAVRTIIKKRKCEKMVIDADALFAIGDSEYKKYNLKGFVLTPHHGEFANLLGIDVNELIKDVLGYGKKFSNDTKSFLVLKGAPTIIFNPKGTAFVNTTGNPGMAKFGTGDVLTGALAGLIAQSNNIESAVLTGVYLHSLAADLLLKKYTEYGYTASDILSSLPNAINFLRKSFA
jgi:NAD(P)H-hydrate epimerase